MKPVKFDYLNPKILNEVLKHQQIDDVKLIVSEQNISSSKIKEVMNQDNQVLDCTLIETSYETLGKKPLAILVFREKNIFNKKNIINSSYKILEKFQIVKNIFRTVFKKFCTINLKIYLAKKYFYFTIYN